MSSTPSLAGTTSDEAPMTLAEAPVRRLGIRDGLGLWGNLGISLLLPVAAVYVVVPGGSLVVTMAAVVVGAVIGSILLGAGAAAGAREGVPGVGLLRGLLGRRTSYLPTALNLLQCVGWATFEVLIIAESAARVLHTSRWPWVLVAGGLATLMALRPLGAVRLLSRYAVWASIAALGYLFVRVLSAPLHPITGTEATSFWTAVDIVVALAGSWFPLAADSPRHARGVRAAFTGSSVGYGTATVVMFALGVLTLAAYGRGGMDVIGALLAVPLGLLALLLLVVLELDEAFANIYSTAISAQNIGGRVDRRILALAVGVVATLLALTFDITAYQSFLYLIGAVFVPLVAVFSIAYFLPPRGLWDVSKTAPARPLFLLPWAAGFVAYQLTLPTYFEGPGAGWTAWWSARQSDLGISATNGWWASLISLAVAAVLTLPLCVPAVIRARRVRTP